MNYVEDNVFLFSERKFVGKVIVLFVKLNNFFSRIVYVDIIFE